MAAPSLALVKYLVGCASIEGERLEQLREVCRSILGACGTPIFLTSIEVAWVHITMAQIVLAKPESSTSTSGAEVQERRTPLTLADLPQIDVQGLLLPDKTALCFFSRDCLMPIF